MTAQSLRARFKETVAVAILDAAEHVAGEAGLGEASLQAIAQRAGVAVGTIYNHFEDREELFAELFARRKQELFDVMDAAMKRSSTAPFEVQLDVFVRTLFAHFDERRAYLRIFFGAEGKAAHISKGAEKRSPLQQRAERIVKLGIKQKKLRSEGADLSTLYLLGMFRAVLIARIESPSPFVDETDGVVKLFLHGAAR